MGETTLYLDPWSGISGDMLLAALLDTDHDAGGLEEELRRVVASLGVGGVTVAVTRDVEWGVACTRVAVADAGSEPLRHLTDMEKIVAGAAVPPRVRTRSLKAVRRLAEVEAAIHGCGVDEIHFHEVGAVDTLVDVVGVFALVEALGIDEVYVGTIPVGGGSVEIAHGRMGVPAPATARLLEGYVIVGGPEARELTTPTGALLVSQLGARVGGLPSIRSQQVGYGAGAMKLERGPNLLRVVLGRAVKGAAAGEGLRGAAESPADEAAPGDVVVELQTNLDDLTGEVVGHTIQLLRAAGALDVWTVPAQMKKDRPGVVLHALVDMAEESLATGILFEQTGTLGIRRQLVSRHVAARGTVDVTVSGRSVRVKWGRWEGRVVSVAPEYEDCVAVSAASGLALKDVMHVATEAALRMMS